MDRSIFKLPEPEVKKPKPQKPDQLSGISLPLQKPTIRVSQSLSATASNESNKGLRIADNQGIPTDKALPEEETVDSRQIPESDTDFPKEEIIAEEPKPANTTEVSSYFEQNISNNNNFKQAIFDNFKMAFVIFKQRKFLVAIPIILIVIVALLLLWPKSKNNVVATQNTTFQSQDSNSNNALAEADFIVFGLAQNSLFYANRSDYQRDANTGGITVEAKSTITGDSRRIAISEQRVPGNFETDPYGLKNLLASLGETYKLSTKTGTSYIVKAFTTGLALRGETLIFIRTTVTLTKEEWINVFDNLQPIVINELGI